MKSDIKVAFCEVDDHVVLSAHCEPTPLVVHMCAEEARQLLCQTMDSVYRHPTDVQHFCINEQRYEMDPEVWRPIHTALESWYNVHVEQFLPELDATFCQLT